MLRGKEKTASIALLWKLPHRVPGSDSTAEPLAQLRSRKHSSCRTPFPPDDRSIGYERGTSVSKAWDQATTDAAIEVAGYVADHLKELAGVQDGAADREREGPRILPAIRRAGIPAAAHGRTEDVLHRSPVQGEPGSRNGRQAGDALVLKSPRFLYREIGSGKLDGYDVASRLSFGLWDSVPDAPLLEAAAAGQLANRDQVTRQAERMVTDLRARSKLREFFLQWLKVDQVPGHRQGPQTVSLNSMRPIASDLRTSLELFLDDVIGGESADFRQLSERGLPLSQRPAGAALRCGSPAGRAVPEGLPGTSRACRRACPTLT